MNLRMSSSLAANYKSGCQRARVVTEAWGRDNLFCPRCTSNRLDQAPPNTQAIDYVCPDCEAPFQLKSQGSQIGDTIQDAGFFAMMKAIREDRTPHLFVMHYDRSHWDVLNVILVPQFAFTPSAIVRRKPLAATARRAGWVGCNIALKNIPQNARIPIISQGQFLPKEIVRKRFMDVSPLKDLSASVRGWTLDVLRMVQSFGKRRFTTNEAYCFESELARFYPGNKHIQAKIRQQLQVLRDKGFLRQVERGTWEVS